MTKQEYIDSVALLEGAFNREMPKEQHAAWYAVLNDLDAESFRKAIIAFLSEGDDWPTVAKIRKLATEQVHGVSEGAYEALANVRKALRKYHPDISGSERDALALLSPAEAAALRSVGGFRRFSDVSTNEAGTLTAQFRDAFNEVSGSDRRMKNLPAPVRPLIELDLELVGAVRELSQKMSAVDELNDAVIEQAEKIGGAV